MFAAHYKPQAGVSLIEVMLVSLLVSSLAAFAVPSVGALLQSFERNTIRQTLEADIRRARSEAQVFVG